MKDNMTKTAKRDNSSKPPVDKVLLFKRGLEMLATHMAAGEAKYPNDSETGQPNWMLGGKPDEEYLGAATRHLMKLRSGEFYDEEMGTPHGAAIVWNILAMLTLNYADHPLTAEQPEEVTPPKKVFSHGIDVNSFSQPQPKSYSQGQVVVLLSQMVNTTKSILRDRDIPSGSVTAEMSQKFSCLIKGGDAPVYSGAEVVNLITSAAKVTDNVLKNYIAHGTAEKVTEEVAAQITKEVAIRMAESLTPEPDPYYGDGNENTL